MNKQIHTTPNGKTILVSEEMERPYSSLNDYDEWVDNAVGVNKNHRNLKNMNTKIFSNNQSFIVNLVSHLETDVGAYCVSYAEETKRRWELETSSMKGTHGDVFKVDYDKVAYQIFNNRWKPVVENYIKFLEEAIKDQNYAANVLEHLEDIVNTITFKNYELTQPIADFFEELPNWLETYTENNSDLLSELKTIIQTWVDRLKEASNISEEIFKVNHLDAFIEFFHEMDYSTNNFTLCTPDGEDALDVSELMKNTLFDLYFRYNPYTFLGSVGEDHYNYSFSLESDSTNVDEDTFFENNCIIIAENQEGANSVESGINQFLNGNWYVAEEIIVVTDENKHEHSLGDLEKTSEGVYYVSVEGSCVGGFESIEAAVEHFSFF